MEYILAIEGGATQTRIGLFDAAEKAVGINAAGPTNVTEYGVAHTAAVLARASEPLLLDLPRRAKVTLGAAIAGAGFGETSRELADALLSRLNIEKAIVTNDLVPIFIANIGVASGVLAIAGTGSSILVQNNNGAPIRVGGRGPLFGEPGSAYAIAVRALRAAADAHDGCGPETVLSETLPQHMGLDSIDDFVAWQRTATKAAIAELARVVDAAAINGDSVAISCIQQEATALAELTIAAAKHHGATDSVSFYGSVFMNSSCFMSTVLGWLAENAPNTHFELATVRDVTAVQLMVLERPSWVPVYTRRDQAHQLETEQRLLTERSLDEMDALEIARTMAVEDARAAAAVTESAHATAQAIEAAAAAFNAGGRLIYIGAGTSGRLGVLDASECPPTFNVPSTQVVGIIAGGLRALSESVEGAEDDAKQGCDDLDALQPPVNGTDFVVGITASGTAPYVLGALKHAIAQFATTAIVTCNKTTPAEADIVIALNTGPEVLPGSTRLKAGTATKMVLNQISTGAMALSGRVFEGYMVGVQPVNIKLSSRTIRIVSALTGRDEKAAKKLLKSAGNRIAIAVLMDRSGADAKKATQVFDEERGNLRAALQRLQKSEVNS